MARTKRRDQHTSEILERQLQALDLRKQGLSYRAIGARLNISHEQARTDVESELRIMADANHEKASENRQLELERLDFITKSLDHWVACGNPQATAVYIRAMERRAKLMGLDAPMHLILDVDITILKELKRKADSAGWDLAEIFQTMIQEAALADSEADSSE